MKRGVKSVFIIFSIILTIFIALSLLVNAAIFNNDLDTNLTSYWSFNGSANDSQGSNHGTVYGGASLVNSCISGQAYPFDGIDDYINCGQDVTLPSTGVITVSAWVNFTDSQHAAIVGRFIAQNDRTGDDAYVVNSSGGFLAIFTDTGDIELKGDCTVQASCGSGIFEIYSGGLVASINSTGDLCLEAGDCDIDSSCSAGSLTINESGTIVSSINSSGSLCYTGNLIERGFG